MLYTSKRDAYRELFPDLSADEVQSSIAYKINNLNMTWEEALRATIDKPPESRNDQIFFNGRKYKSKKALLRVLFPKKRYESIYYSIRLIIDKENLSFEDALKRYKDKGKPNNLKKEIEYNGIRYKSLRSACRALGLKPERISYMAKEKFNNNYKKAIDYSLKEKR